MNLKLIRTVSSKPSPNGLQFHGWSKRSWFKRAVLYVCECISLSDLNVESYELFGIEGLEIKTETENYGRE